MSRPTSSVSTPENGFATNREVPPGGKLLVPSSASPDALDFTGSGMDKKDIGHPKPSRGKSFLSRKSVKRSESQDQIQTRSNAETQSLDENLKGKERAYSEDLAPPRPLFPHRSIIPDPLNELPAWFTMDHSNVSSAIQYAAQFRSRYPLWNPIGPRWYKNHHLHPSRDKRPPTVFSPSFPPMAASADRSQDGKTPGPSRTPSGSPLPTPSSSQVRIHDVRARTRKTSQTAHDDVDMMDVTDPWGTNWHHESPYDVGSNQDKVAAANEAPMQPRPRRRSMTAPASRHKSITPSPLSQSTSAVHLSIDPTTIRMPRKLNSPHIPGHTSEPPTPLETSGFHMLKRGSTVAPSRSSTTPSLIDKKEKRGSVLGRLVKRFSILRRSDTTRGPPSTYDNHRNLGNRASVHMQPAASKSSPAVHKTTAPSVAPSDMSKRVPPPSIQETLTQPSVDLRTPKDDEAASFTSSEAPSSIRKLTIANPDEPSGSDSNTPVMETSHLPTVQEARPELERLNIPSNEPRTSVLDVPISNSPAPLHSPVENSPHVYQSRLSTILSALSDHPGTSSSPPLPDLPPPTPGPISPGIIPSEHSLPPTPLPTRPPSPSESTISSVLPPLPPRSPSLRSHDGLTRAMSPSALSAFKATLPEIEESPLSRASMVVNPPTPMPPTIAIPKSPALTPVPMPPVQPIQQATPQSSEESKSSRDHSPTKKEGSQRVKNSSSSKVRRTETFKLVRSPSGHVQSVGEGFVVEGEHWEVVASPVEESSKSRKKSRTKSKEEEAPPQPKESRQNSRHERRSEDDNDPQKTRDRHRRSVNGRHHADASGSGSSHAPQHVNGHTTQNDSPERRRSSHRVAKSASTDATPTERHERRRSSTKESRPREPEAVRSTQTPTAHASTSYTQSTQLSSVLSTSRRERKASTSTRPTSEIQSSADVNALRAKEAWDMDRLWKGRSMVYAPDGTTMTSNRPTIGSDSRPSTIMSADLHRAASIPSVGDLARTSPIPMAHGSSHTYFMVQAPYQGQPNGHSHSSSGSQSPPIIYAPSSPNQSSSPHRDYSKHYRSFADAVPFPTTNPSDHASQRLSNPLPEPPRLSAYRPSPLPSSIAGSGEGPSSPEYWASLAGVTSTH
ncbi:hypothetical protein QCA50_002168 [Cerrena zonata]|uniref:Uncharacterized protein n=1 Tax=Cerrena zonata TaxID=2478898 RepID=A0AAW0GP57_9APHY